MDQNFLTLTDIEKIFCGRAPGVVGEYSYYSVLVPLAEKDGVLHLLYEVRAEGMKRQPGEVCFPGGKLEENETPEQCALRETVEELGIEYEDIRLISQLDSMYTYSNFTMYAFLGVIDAEKLLHAKCNPDEVKEIFLVPVSYLLETEPYIYKMDIIPNIKADFPYDLVNFSNGYNWRKGTSEVPIYHYKKYVIWGLTARITHNFMEIVRQNMGA